MRESPWLREIRTLDPDRDCRRIVLIDSFHEFPFDTTRALELAFFKTFASPTIAALLDSTGEFRLRGQKRYDDTDLRISTFSEDGWTGERGKRALRRMNQIHGRFDIANEDFLYVLSAMALEPLRWNERFGWRRMIEAERLATFNVEYERSRFMATQAGARLAQAQQNVFLAWFPVVPNRVGARAISALLDEHVVEALGLVRATSVERKAAAGAVRLRSRLVRPLPARRRPRLRTPLRRRSYPGGYTIEQLGPPPASAARTGQ